MSHVSHLFHGELGDWCAERLTGTADISRHIASQVRGVPLTRPPGRKDKHHWNQADKTFVNRLAEMVQPAPPYSALLGLVRVGVVSMAWAHRQAALYPTHVGLSEAERERALDLRPTLRGWVDLRSAYDQGAPEAAATSEEQGYRIATRPGFPDEDILAELLERIRRYIATNARLGRLGSRGPETGLVRLCWLIAAFGYSYRNDGIGHPIFRLFRDSTPSVAELHAAADNLAVEDPLSLIDRLITSGSLDRIRSLAQGGEDPLGVVRPVIFDHWNDSHLVLDDGKAGATLLEVSSPIRVDATDRTGRRVWNLLASAWLDTADDFRIRSVGIYLARHGTLITWPLEELAYELVQGRNPHQARADFVDLARRLRAQDHARRLDRRDAQTLPWKDPEAVPSSAH